MCYLLTNLSKEAGRLHHWRGPLFQRRYQAIPVSSEEDAQTGRLRYILSHGCKEGLVAKVCQWPGAHCAHSLATGEPSAGVWFDRHQWRGLPRGRLPPRLLPAPAAVLRQWVSGGSTLFTTNDAPEPITSSRAFSVRAQPNGRASALIWRDITSPVANRRSRAPQ
jgi:hypothetical protein